MLAKDLISRLMEFPSDAEVLIQGPEDLAKIEEATFKDDQNGSAKIVLRTVGVAVEDQWVGLATESPGEEKTELGRWDIAPAESAALEGGLEAADDQATEEQEATLSEWTDEQAETPLVSEDPKGVPSFAATDDAESEEILLTSEPMSELTSEGPTSGLNFTAAPEPSAEVEDQDTDPSGYRLSEQAEGTFKFDDQAVADLEGEDIHPEYRVGGSGGDVTGTFGIGDEAGVDELTEAGEKSEAEAAPARVTPGGRPPKKKKNMLAELVKVVLGGALGLFIGYLALLWVIKKDILPPTASYLPGFMVPDAVEKKYGAKTEQSMASSSSSTPTETPAENAAPDPGEIPDVSDRLENAELDPGVGVTDVGPDALDPVELDAAPPETIPEESPLLEPDNVSVMPDLDTGSIPPTPPGGEPLDGIDELDPAKLATEPSEISLPPLEPVEVDPAKTAATDTEKSTEDMPEEKEPSAEQPAPPAITVRDAPAYAIADLEAALTSAREAHKSLVDAKTGDQKELDKLRVKAYRSLSQLAEQATFAKADTSGDLEPRMEAVTTLLREAADGEKFDQLGRLAGMWLSASKRKDNGVVLAGTVESVEQAGPLYQTRLRLSGEGGKTVTSVSPSKPGYESNNRAVILGSIVSNPAENIPGLPSEVAVDESGILVWQGPAITVDAGAKEAAPPAEQSAPPESPDEKPADEAKPPEAAGEAEPADEPADAEKPADAAEKPANAAAATEKPTDAEKPAEEPADKPADADAEASDGPALQ